MKCKFQTGHFDAGYCDQTKNNQCQNATAIALNPEENDLVFLQGTTRYATVDTSFNRCTETRYNVRGASVWYTVAGTGSRISISTCHSQTNIDTVIFVYASSACSQTTDCLYSIPAYSYGSPAGEVAVRRRSPFWAWPRRPASSCLISWCGSCQSGRI